MFGNAALRRGSSRMPTALCPSLIRRRISRRYGHRLFAVTCLLGAAVFGPTAAFAVCTPGTGDNVTVTCSNATQNQGPEANTGYGSGLQNGLTINMQAPASVVGTSIGIDVGSNNTVNNLGFITTAGNGVIGDVFGLQANGTNLTVTNSGTIGRLDIPNNLIDAAGINAMDTGLMVTNKAGATIEGSTGIQGLGTGTVVNSGLITGLTGGGGGEGINFNSNNTSTVTVTNNATGVITGDAFGINANSAVVFNYGTISAPTAGNGGTGLNAKTLVLTNYATGLITGDAFGVSGSLTPNLTVTNFGTISSTGLAGVAIGGSVVTIVNSGTITSATGSAGTGISTSSAASPTMPAERSRATSASRLSTTRRSSTPAPSPAPPVPRSPSWAAAIR
jgi:fibronectin-binding autotransporter adhesin